MDNDMLASFIMRMTVWDNLLSDGAPGGSKILRKAADEGINMPMSTKAAKQISTEGWDLAKCC
jgi:hypothetical protein